MNNTSKDNIIVRNAFLAGAVSASLLWSFAAWFRNTWKGEKRRRMEHEKGLELDPYDNRSQQQQHQEKEIEIEIEEEIEEEKEPTSPPSIIYNPWKTNEAVLNRQLLELRESLIEHSRRTSLLLLDKILNQSQSETFTGELPSKKRLRWPWESLRKHLSKENENDNEHNETNKHVTEETAGKQNSNDTGTGTGTAGIDDINHSLHEIQKIPSLQSDMSNSHHEEVKEICIGSIFGLDVGGTLSKLVYFEKKREDHNTCSSENTRRSQSQSSRTMYKSDDVCRTRSAERFHFRGSSENCGFHESCSQDDLQSTTYPLHSPSNAPDISMKRSHSLFDLTSKKAKREKALDRFYEFANRLDTYDTDVKDKGLSFYSRALGGEIHFIQFETRFLPQAMDLIQVNDLHLNISKMGATGGGAHKYADKWEKMLAIEIVKQDELDSLVAGMQFILSDVVGECYTFLLKGDNEKDQSNKKKADQKDDLQSVPEQSQPFASNQAEESSLPIPTKEEEKPASPPCNEKSRKVQRDFVARSDSYPYLLVMIGTGVSVLRVDGPRKHERISGSTIGGGTYWGLCRLLTDVEDFESVLNLAERGDPSKVDMMVGDIYGKDSNALDKLGLTADIVASSFGKLVAKQDPAAGLKQEDLARALLLMVTNNIGQVAYLNAQLHGTKSIYFVGNFLRHNSISQQRLSYAINYWSRGKMEALFLEHEGYFGALGAFLLHQGISADKDGNVAQSKTEGKSHGGKTARKRALSF